jgi:hypothetical protein
LGVQELGMFDVLNSWPPYFGVHNFFISNLLLMIFSALDAPRGGIQNLLGHQKQKSPCLGCRLP